MLVEQNTKQSIPVTTKAQGAVVVIGSGPVGVDFCRKLSALTDAPIYLYGDEHYSPYNRVKLSLYLSGEVKNEDLFYDVENDPMVLSGQVTLRLGQPVVHIDRDKKVVINQAGETQSYDKLILATGATSWVPPLACLDASGVYSFRDLKDADHLLARLARSQHTVIIGAGLLGLEMAKGLARHGTRVTVLDMNAWVLYRQLNEPAAEIVESYFESLGINIVTRCLLKEIVADQANRLQGVYVSHQKELFACDTLIFATGSRPNVALAKQAGLRFSEGIRVNHYLQTSDKSIYAIGDCAEFDGQVQGIVSPGYEQSSVAANHIVGRSGVYDGSHFTTRLKVAGIEVFCAGDEDDLHRSGVTSYAYQDKDGNYRCLLVANNRIVYVIAIGEFEEASRIAEAIHAQRRYLSFQFARFARTGLFFGDEQNSIAHWPKNAVVCHCMAVTRGELSDAIMHGAHSIEALQQKTHACTVCGSCQPNIENLLAEETEGKVKRSAIGYAKPLQWFGLLTILSVFLMAMMPSLPLSETALNVGWDVIWLDGDYKQVTGYSLLGLSVLALLVSVSKRYVEKLKPLFINVRLFHVLLATIFIIALVLHTGNSFGEGLNRWLMIDFSLVLLLGGLMSVWMSVEHRVSSSAAMKLRKWFGWSHLLAVWLLPALLGFHILSVYYF